jgi:hypothetical protein
VEGKRETDQRKRVSGRKERDGPEEESEWKERERYGKGRGGGHD